jgi:succinate-semialdehyde dehydrogenase / glutarate-semialdehyde dehydrogenase
MYKANLFIGGKQIENTASGRFTVINPATEEALGSAPLAGKDEVDAAISAARSGFNAWRQSSPQQRFDTLNRIGALMRERVESMAILLTMEIGKPLAESRGEVIASAEYFEWCAKEALRASVSSRPGRVAGSTLEVTYEPVGIVLALTAWNYPVILAARKLAMALAAGCSVILRPAEEGPACVASLVQCCQDAGLPAGTINLLFGAPQSVVEPLMASHIVRKVSFTGSTRVGQLLIAQSAATVKRVTMELGGHAPFIVLEDADVEKAAQAAAMGKFRNAGQVCTSPSRFFVHADVCSTFTQRMTELATSIRLGNGMDAGVQMGPLATAKQRQRAERLVSDSRDRGARVECGGGRPSGHDRGYFFQPTIITHLTDESSLLSDEPFAPIAAIVPVDSLEEAVARSNALEFGLAAYLFTRSKESINRVTAEIEAGVVGVNTVTAALAEAPFGGIKQSGFGREGGEDCLRDFQNVKFVHRTPA